MPYTFVVVSFLAGAAFAACATALLMRRSPKFATVQLTEEVPRSGPPALARMVLAAVDVGVIVVDRDEIAIFVNPAARRMGMLSGDTLAIPALGDLVREATDAGEPRTLMMDMADVVAVRRGGESWAVQVRAVPLSEENRVASVVLLLTDVTETRRLESVRRDFVANVSHELKTPVGALTLLAEAVQEAADDPEAVQRFAHRMQREGARLGRLVQELIELSRLQGAEALPGTDMVRVDTIVSEAVDRCRLASEQSKIAVVDRCLPGLWVRGNETQLVTAVANLVHNAVAYSSPHTRVSVTARAMTGDDGSEWAEIAVSDQGIGIAEADLDRVFERFYRVDQARSRATGGTGLGLAIVKHIATNHGGVVSVWSAEDAGSTFTVRLPLADQRTVADPLQEPELDWQRVSRFQ